MYSFLREVATVPCRDGGLRDVASLVAGTAGASGRISGGKVGLAQWSNNAVPHSWHVRSEHLRFKLDNEFWDTFYVFVELYKKAMLVVA